MTLSGAFFALEIMGPFRLRGPDGARIDIPSKKGQALIAMLAMAGGGERTRSWLQNQLWGSRGPEQAQASLRNALSHLRAIINRDGHTLLFADHARVWLDLAQIDVDARAIENPSRDMLLEGLDIPGEEGFEDWLREERGRCAERAAQAYIAAEPAVQSAAPGPGPGSGPGPGPAFASLPALAVLPFTNLTGNSDLDLIAEGLSEDLVDRLSRLRWLPIIARSSSFAFRDAGQDARQIGANLGARYVLEGRLRTAIDRTGIDRVGNDDVQLLVALVDCENGNAVWSNKIALDAEASPHALEDLLTGLTSALGAKIDQEEQSRALRKPQSDLNVRDLIWQGRWHLNKLTQFDAARAKECFAEALAREPNSPEALIQNTWAHLWDLWATRGSDLEIRSVRQMAQKAIIADYDDARGHMLAGIAEMWLRQPIRAETLLRRAILLNPSLGLAYGELGSVLYFRDEPAEAISVLNTATTLSPYDHNMFYFQSELAMSYLMLGNYSVAAEHADKAIMNRSAYWYAHVIKINALVRGGQSEQAKAALCEIGVAISHFKDSFIDWLPFIDAKWNKFLKDGLNQAGD